MSLTLKEEYFSTDMMSMNIDVGWRMSLDSDWELFGGEVKLDGVSYDCNTADWHADGTGDVGWQAAEDDTASVCSSVTSWSCLQGNSLFETYSEMYSDPCKPEDEEKVDELLPKELIDDIASCLNSGFVSLEQFYEINRLIDADASVDDVHPPDSLINTDVMESELVDVGSSEAEESESCGSDVAVVSEMPDDADVSPFVVNDADSRLDPYSSDSALVSLECEELYEESIAVEDVPSTISCEEFEHLMTSSPDQFVVEFEPSEDIRTSNLRWHTPCELTNSRRLRKKEQNKSAASRYRLKKRSEQGLVLSEYTMLERRNIELRTRLDVMNKEIMYLKSLIDELCS